MVHFSNYVFQKNSWTVNKWLDKDKKTNFLELKSKNTKSDKGKTDKSIIISWNHLTFCKKYSLFY